MEIHNIHLSGKILELEFVALHVIHPSGQNFSLVCSSTLSAGCYFSLCWETQMDLLTIDSGMNFYLKILINLYE